MKRKSGHIINVRSVNVNCRVIVYIKREELRQTLHASGVTYVASPFELSGRLIASAAFEPRGGQVRRRGEFKSIGIRPSAIHGH